MKYSQHVILILLLLISLTVTTTSFGQLREKGAPYSLGKGFTTQKVPIAQMRQIDMNKVSQEDRVNDLISEIPYRFGIEHDVNLGLSNVGLWEDLPNGDRMWRFAIYAPKAKSINLVFDDYFLPEGAKFHIYNEGYEQILGAFTSRNNKTNGTFSTALVYGETSYLEYYEPANVKGEGRIHINMVVHGYRSIFEKSNAQLGNSGNCNIDTECPQADNWRDELKAAGKTIAGGGLCSGTLVGNTTGDRRPLFLTANHCGFSNTVIVYWRFERPNCGSGIPDDTQTTSGAMLLADVDGNPGGNIRSSDHLLMELDENPADSYDIYFAGWDATGAPVQSATGIHHPAGDAKKISMENNPLTCTGYTQTAVNPNGSHWRVIDWDSGTTEGGSSGSALFDNSTQRLIGMLSGGGAACGNNQSDWYGKFSVAWSNNGTTDPSERLRDWLDPNNTGTMAIDGYGLSDILISTTSDPVINTCGTDVEYEFDIALANSVTSVTFSASGLPTGTTASFDTNPASADGTYTLTIAGIAGAATGSYMITINATDGTTSEDLTFELILDDLITASPSLLTPINGSTGESTNPVFTWNTIQEASEYIIEIAADSGFSNIIETGITTSPSYIGIPLSSNTQYFWRISAENSCGIGSSSMVYSFETDNITCQSYTATDTPLSIPTTAPPNIIISSITVVESGNITDLNILNLDIEHTWIADLTVTLTHVETGTSAALFTTPCLNQDDILGNFDDAGGALPCPPNGGTYAPEDLFSIFIGESVTGTWTLTVSDGANLDGGSFESWTLELCGNLGIDDCPPDYNLTGVQSTTEDYETDGTIVSDQIIDSNATVDYDSGTSILLEENFETVSGVTFHAFIDGCMGAMLQGDNTNTARR